MTEREKIAQIIAEHLCPQGRAHKTLYGAERTCYSRNNFADCEKVSDCVDALIAAGFGDVSAAKAEQEEIKLFNASIKNGEIEMTVGSAGFKTFFALVEQIFKQNGASAFLTTTIEGGNDIKYAVTIQRVGEKSPAEELRQATELWKHEKHRAEVAERALLRLCEETMRDKLIIMYPSVGIQVRDKQELYDYCIEKAERELAEEG